MANILNFKNLYRTETVGLGYKNSFQLICVVELAV